MDVIPERTVTSSQSKRRQPSSESLTARCSATSSKATSRAYGFQAGACFG